MAWFKNIDLRVNNQNQKRKKHKSGEATYKEAKITIKLLNQISIALTRLFWKMALEAYGGEGPSLVKGY